MQGRLAPGPVGATHASPLLASARYWQRRRPGSIGPPIRFSGIACKPAAARGMRATHGVAPTAPNARGMKGDAWRRPYFDDSTNWLPSASLKTAAVPQSAFVGGFTNSTPRSASVRAVASTSSARNVRLLNPPMRSS